MKRQNGHLYRGLCGIGAALICLLLLLPSLPFRMVEAQSQTPTQTLNDTSEEHETDAIIQVFFDALMKGNSTSAFDELFRHSVFLPTEVEQLSMMIRNKLAELSIRNGKILDYKKINTKRIDEDFVLGLYITKSEKAPQIWVFAFYRNPTTTGITNDNPWALVQFNLEADLRLLLQQ